MPPSQQVDFSTRAYQCSDNSPLEPIDDSPSIFTDPTTARRYSPTRALPTPGVLIPRADGLMYMVPIPLRDPSLPDIPTENNEYRKHSCSFWRFFSLAWELEVARDSEMLVSGFCLATKSGKHLIFATYEPGGPTDSDADAATDNVPGVANLPKLAKFTLSLVDIDTGKITDRWNLVDDFVMLDGHGGVHMYGNLLLVLSLRNQVLHVLKIHESTGRFISQGQVGSSCRQDDHMEIARVKEIEEVYQRKQREVLKVKKKEASSSCPFSRSQNEKRDAGSSSTSPGAPAIPWTPLAAGNERRNRRGNERRRRRPISPIMEHETFTSAADDAQAPAPPRESGLGNGRLNKGFYEGLMQRLLVFLYRKYHNINKDSLFYRVVGQYSLLLMLKAQFLDEDHLLIRLGSHERNAKDIDAAKNTCFLVIYCISTAKILNLFDNQSQELLAIFEKYRDVIVGDPAVVATMPAAPSYLGGGSSDINGEFGRANGSDGLSGGDGEDLLASRRSAAAVNDRHRRTQVALAALPFSCQVRNVSPYLDRRLFSYSHERLPALDGSKALSFRDVDSVKFVCPETGALRFKLRPGIPVSLNRRRRIPGDFESLLPQIQRKKKALFLFHPFQPFVISMEHSPVSPTTYNFHVHGHA